MCNALKILKPVLLIASYTVNILITFRIKVVDIPLKLIVIRLHQDLKDPNLLPSYSGRMSVFLQTL